LVSLRVLTRGFESLSTFLKKESIISKKDGYIMTFNIIYITTKDKAEAEKIGKALVESKLAACVNIIDGMTAIYRWEGKIQEANEAILIAKTKETLVPELTEKVKSIHSYSCPCIIALPILGGSDEYLEWISSETK
jgi:periplasmic divalent cation tolerance protein